MAIDQVSEILYSLALFRITENRQNPKTDSDFPGHAVYHLN
jgi:hypothetical protein